MSISMRPFMNTIILTSLNLITNMIMKIVVAERIATISTVPAIKKITMEEIRIDKYLWAVRIFKTRSDSAEACKSGRVTVNGQNAKSSKEIKKGDRIEIRKGAVHYEYIVAEPLDKRVGAQLVEKYLTNITPQSELDKLAAPIESFFVKRDRGSGRPTKKERRDIDKMRNNNDF